MTDTKFNYRYYNRRG